MIGNASAPGVSKMLCRLYLFLYLILENGGGIIYIRCLPRDKISGVVSGLVQADSESSHHVQGKINIL